MKLTQEIVDELIKTSFSTGYRQARQDDYDRWIMYNGAIKKIVEETIRKEFQKPETVSELIHRIVPLNIIQKIILKLAGVYNEAPVRKPADKNEMDQELIDQYVAVTKLDIRQKENNRYFKLFKRSLQEIYLDNNKNPAVRNLPRHTWEVFSHSGVSPEKPDTVLKFLNIDKTDPEKTRIIIWTDENMWLVNGKGKKLEKEMEELKNSNGENPYGTLPFVFTNESSFDVVPISDDDLMRMAIVIPLLISDLAFAVKYLAWAVVYTIGSNGDVPFSPNSVIHLPFGPAGEKPEIGTVKPEVDIDQVIRFVNMLMGILLSTKNLSVGTVSTDLNVETMASGVAKILDSAESREDKKDQQAYFLEAEDQFWTKLSKNMIPYWRKNQMLKPELNKEFSPGFQISVEFREPKVLMSEKEQLELSAMKLEKGFSTLERELSSLNPNMDSEEVKNLTIEIMQYQAMKNNMQFEKLEVHHKHSGTGEDEEAEGGHYHEMLDGSGDTSIDEGGPGHTHTRPDGTETDGPTIIKNKED